MKTGINKWLIHHTWFHGNVSLSYRFDNSLLVTTPTCTLFLHEGFRFLLDVHHTPYDEDEHESVHKQTQGRGAPSRGSDPGPEDPPDQSERFRVGNHKECETRDKGGVELLLLLLTVTTASTIFKKNTHDLF